MRHDVLFHVLQLLVFFFVNYQLSNIYFAGNSSAGRAMYVKQ